MQAKTLILGSDTELSAGLSGVKFLWILVESVLLYGSETWILTKNLEKSIDGTYTSLLRTVFNVSWSEHLTNRELYGNLPKVTDKIRERRLKLAGHCVRHSEEVASNLVLWQPSQGKPNRGRKRKTYLDNLMNDTNKCG